MSSRYQFQPAPKLTLPRFTFESGTTELPPSLNGGPVGTKEKPLFHRQRRRRTSRMRLRRRGGDVPLSQMTGLLGKFFGTNFS
jgi:hypothetical protein